MDVPAPRLGLAKLLGTDDNPLPGYIHITPRGEGGFSKQDAAFLGPKYASVTLGDGKPPANLLRPDDAHRGGRPASATTLRERLNSRFAQRRRTAETEAYTQSYDQAAQLMQRQRRLRRQQGAARAAPTATARTTSAGTACWPAGCWRTASPSSR